jgi:hypothetical protein
MGYTEFLAGLNGATPSNLPTAIDDLEDASMIFLSRWNRGDILRAGEISKNAMTLFDFITNELLREMVERKGSGNYVGTRFETEMSRSCGRGVTGATLADQQGVVRAGPGNGKLPVSLDLVTGPSLQQLLNKVKHRNPNLMNFRIDTEEHIFVICTDHTYGGPEGIYEFKVSEFCGHCRIAAAEL